MVRAALYNAQCFAVHLTQPVPCSALRNLSPPHGCKVVSVDWLRACRSSCQVAQTDGFGVLFDKADGPADVCRRLPVTYAPWTLPLKRQNVRPSLRRRTGGQTASSSWRQRSGGPNNAQLLRHGLRRARFSSLALTARAHVYVCASLQFRARPPTDVAASPPSAWLLCKRLAGVGILTFVRMRLGSVFRNKRFMLAHTLGECDCTESEALVTSAGGMIVTSPAADYVVSPLVRVPCACVS